MTELHHPAVRAEPNWPELDIQETESAGGRDEAVTRAIESLRDIPGLPLAQHPEYFAATHDALLAALNDEAPVPARPGGPQAVPASPGRN